MNELIKGYL